MTTRIAINGFGRIGRSVLRASLLRGDDLEIVAVNDLAEPATLAHLLRYDTVLGRLPERVEVTDDGLLVGGHKIKAFAEREPACSRSGDWARLPGRTCGRHGPGADYGSCTVPLKRPLPQTGSITLGLVRLSN